MKVTQVKREVIRQVDLQITYEEAVMLRALLNRAKTARFQELKHKGEVAKHTDYGQKNVSSSFFSELHRTLKDITTEEE